MCGGWTPACAAFFCAQAAVSGAPTPPQPRSAMATCMSCDGHCGTAVRCSLVGRDTAARHEPAVTIAPSHGASGGLRRGRCAWLAPSAAPASTARLRMGRARVRECGSGGALGAPQVGAGEWLQICDMRERGTRGGAHASRSSSVGACEWLPVERARMPKVGSTDRSRHAAMSVVKWPPG